MGNPMLISILGGIAVVILIEIAVITYKKVILPYIDQINYKGVNLSGDWICYYDDSESGNPNQQISIIQKGQNLKGVIRIHMWAEGSPANEELLFSGSIRGEKTFITFENKKSQNIVYGAHIFQIQDGGDKLVGKVVSIEPTDLVIYTEDRIWHKK